MAGGARLDHVQVAMPAGREADARAFYGDLLGLTEVAKPAALSAAGGVWFGEGLHLGVETPFVPARKAHPALAVSDLALVARRLEAAGYEVAWDTRIPGVRRFHTSDPFGNRVEILGSG